MRLHGVDVVVKSAVDHLLNLIGRNSALYQVGDVFGVLVDLVDDEILVGRRNQRVLLNARDHEPSSSGWSKKVGRAPKGPALEVTPKQAEVHLTDEQER